jgi:3-hydroxyacyl-CoA dehydrogenase
LSAITTRKDGDVLVVTSSNPPVNALGAEVRRGLVEAIEQADSDALVKAVVIIGAGRTFFAGADITEFGRPMQEPALPEVVDRIEASGKPVVAAIHGTALGGGLEVALACHYRVAVPSAKLGLPEVKLGILPGAGGTQRLPRVVGVAAALPMIVSGDPIPAKKAQAIGLLDRVVGESSLETDAVAFAREIAARAEHPVASRGEAKAEPGMFDHFRQENARQLKGFEAPEACIQAVQAAATLPFEQGIAMERELFMKLVTSDQSKALRHLFFAERAASRIDGVSADTPLIPINTVGILGAGTMGGGIAMNFLSADIPVTIVEREQAALDRGVSIIRRNYEATAKKGRMTAEQVEQAMALLTPTLTYDDLADCDLVIEAVFELMAIKRDVFTKLDGIVKQGAILASNTSYLDIDAIAACTKRPESVIGVHFFSPANVMKLLEIVRGAKTSDTVLASAMALAKKVRKVAVVAGVCHGFIGNRMLEPRQRQANALLLEGAKVADVDQALLNFGFPMGPFQMADLAGLDIGWDPAKSDGANNLRDMLCEAGLRGQKSGHGFYDYDEKRNRTSSARVEQMVRDFAAKKGVAQRSIGQQEILERLLYPMVNEGALILEEGKAQRASDIDIVWLNGYGWPAWTGGPMFWADTVGLDILLAGLEKHASRIEGFRLSKLLADKATTRGRLTG